MTSRSASQTLPGSSWRTHGLPRSGREQPRSAPGVPQERPRSVPGATSPANSAPEAAQRPPGSHTGAILHQCWPLPAFIFKLLSYRLRCACGFFCATFGAACPLLSHVVLNAFRTTCANKGARQHTREHARNKQEPAKASTAPTKANHRMSRTCKTLHTPRQAIRSNAANETLGTQGGRR